MPPKVMPVLQHWVLVWTGHQASRIGPAAQKSTSKLRFLPMLMDPAVHLSISQEPRIGHTQKFRETDLPAWHGLFDGRSDLVSVAGFGGTN